MDELEKLSVKIPIDIPAFEDMTWIEKEMIFGGHIFFFDGKGGYKELDSRNVYINPIGV